MSNIKIYSQEIEDMIAEEARRRLAFEEAIAEKAKVEREEISQRLYDECIVEGAYFDINERPLTGFQFYCLQQKKLDLPGSTTVNATLYNALSVAQKEAWTEAAKKYTIAENANNKYTSIARGVRSIKRIMQKLDVTYKAASVFIYGYTINTDEGSSANSGFASSGEKVNAFCSDLKNAYTDKFEGFFLPEGAKTKTKSKSINGGRDKDNLRKQTLQKTVLSQLRAIGLAKSYVSWSKMVRPEEAKGDCIVAENWPENVPFKNPKDWHPKAAEDLEKAYASDRPPFFRRHLPTISFPGDNMEIVEEE